MLRRGIFRAAPGTGRSNRPTTAPGGEKRSPKRIRNPAARGEITELAVATNNLDTPAEPPPPCTDEAALTLFTHTRSDGAVADVTRVLVAG